jgi:acetyl-CoA synthetase
MTTLELTEAQIAVHWKEEDYFYPPQDFVRQANLRDPNAHQRFALDKFPQCFDEYANLLTWSRKWDQTLDSSNPPFWKWFVGGELNASYNCIDRHLATSASKNAIVFVPEPEDEPDVVLTYQDLYDRVNEVAAVLRDFCALQPGDRVTIHMPLVPELPITMLACARLGIVHSVVFGGFSGTACGQRIADSGSRVLISMDGYHRNGAIVDHKEKVTSAIEAAAAEGQEIEKVLVWRRYPDRYLSDTPMHLGRDFFMDTLLTAFAGAVVEPAIMPSTAPLFLMYTSGTTAKPKGCQHSTGGYLSYVTGTAKNILDIHPEDVYWCMADIGWITGHSYIVYGPLSLGTTNVIYEGVPTYPDAGRPWRIAERLNVNIFHTAPTAIRMLRKVGPDTPLQYNHQFKLMVTVGEPIEPEVWRWYYETVGKKESVIVAPSPATYGQSRQFSLCGSLQYFA